MHYRSLRGRLPSVYVDEKISVAKTFSDYFLTPRILNVEEPQGPDGAHMHQPP